MANEELIKWLWERADEIDEGGPFYSKSDPYRNAAKALEAAGKEIADLQKENVRLKKYAAAVSEWIEHGSRIPKPDDMRAMRRPKP